VTPATTTFEGILLNMICLR